ncbi:Fc.00g000500.m01.CDS01 [Cosmosporella sp. VM-42]
MSGGREKQDSMSMAVKVEHDERIATRNPDDVEDEVAPEAIGTGNLPPGYFRSAHFIGTMIGVTLMNISLYVGYVLPINVLSIINADIGPSKNIILVPVTKTLGQGVAVILVGCLGDIFGRRWFLIGGQALGAIGSIIGALSTNVNTLMASTAFIGRFLVTNPTLIFTMADVQ